LGRKAYYFFLISKGEGIMKKGLTIALLMVAMVALAASASAVAPIIGNLPAVIIGDAGNTAVVGTEVAHLLKYDNVFNLADKGIINRLNNPTTTSQLSVFYTTSDVTVGTDTLVVSNATAKVSPMTQVEMVALRDGGVLPTAKQINTATSTWLSLIHDNGTLGTAPASAATAAANGSLPGQITALGMLQPVIVTLYAVDGAVDKVGSGSFNVFTHLNEGDSYASTTQVYSSGDLSSTVDGGWKYSTKDATRTGPNANLAAVASFSDASGVGFRGSANFGTGKTQGFSSWEFLNGGVYVATAANMDGKIFRFTAKMSGDNTDAMKTPAYRLLFLSKNFAHTGGFQASSNTGDTQSNPNVPSASASVTARMYWSVPTTTFEYQDGGKASTFDNDGRDYYGTFDIMQNSTTDVGSIVMSDVTIEKILRPADATPQAAFGEIGRGADIPTLAFNDATWGWTAAAGDGGTGWGGGTASAGAGSVAVAMKAAPIKSVFQQVQPTLGDGSIYPVWASNQLVRITWNLKSSNVSTTPDFRMFTLPWVAPNGNFKIGETNWGEAYTPSVFRGWYPGTDAIGGLACTPKTTGSIIETYIYTMNAPTATAERCVLNPTLDIDQAKGTTSSPINFPINGWATPGTPLTIQGFMMEVCGSN